MTKIIEICNLDDAALASICGGNTSLLQQAMHDQQVEPVIGLPPTGANGSYVSAATVHPMNGLPLGPGPVILPPTSGAQQVIPGWDE